MTENNKRANDVVFPSPRDIRNPDGMTLREYFAGQVLQGWMANKERPQFLPKDDVVYCVKIADLLIAELSKESP